MAAQRVRILCDSCVDLPKPLLTERGIAVVPLTVNFGGELLRDGVDIDPHTFYERIQQEKLFPSTSQVTPAEYAPFFREAVADGGEAVYIGLSSGLSGSLQNAVITAADPGLGGRVHVVDSLGASVGLGLMVLKASDLAQAGASAAEIVEQVTAYRDRMCHVFTLDTLEYAHRGGRVSMLSAMASKVLDVKPVLHMDMAGKLIPIDRVRGRKRSLNRLFAEMDRLGGNTAGQRVGICHANAPSEAQELAERFRTQYGASEVIIGEIGPVIGTHTGPGCISIFFEGPAGRG